MTSRFTEVEVCCTINCNIYCVNQRQCVVYRLIQINRKISFLGVRFVDIKAVCYDIDCWGSHYRGLCRLMTGDELTAGSVYLRLTHLLTKPLRLFICEQWKNSLWELKEMLIEILWPKIFRLVIQTLNRANNNLIKRLYFYVLFPSIM